MSELTALQQRLEQVTRRLLTARGEAAKALQIVQRGLIEEIKRLNNAQA